MNTPRKMTCGDNDRRARALCRCKNPCSRRRRRRDSTPSTPFAPSRRLTAPAAHRPRPGGSPPSRAGSQQRRPRATPHRPRNNRATNTRRSSPARPSSRALSPAFSSWPAAMPLRPQEKRRARRQQKKKSEPGHRHGKSFSAATAMLGDARGWSGTGGDDAVPPSVGVTFPGDPTPIRIRLVDRKFEFGLQLPTAKTAIRRFGSIQPRPEMKPATPNYPGNQRPRLGSAPFLKFRILPWLSRERPYI